MKTIFASVHFLVFIDSPPSRSFALESSTHSKLVILAAIACLTSHTDNALVFLQLAYRSEFDLIDRFHFHSVPKNHFDFDFRIAFSIAATVFASLPASLRFHFIFHFVFDFEIDFIFHFIWLDH